MIQKSSWMWISTGLICILIIASYSAAYYYMEYTKFQQLYDDTLVELKKYEPYMFVNVLLDYGNGTSEWHNGTLVSKGADILNATIRIAQVQYSMGQWGAWMSSINGAGGDDNTFWIYNVWNSTSLSWEMGQVAADAYILREGEIFAWIYQKF